MAQIVPVDTTAITADTTRITADRVGTRPVQAGWPCSLLGSSPPSVVDRQSYPTADDVLPAVLALTPRGAAWGTDEAGDGSGASPVMLGLWRALAAYVADVSARDFDTAVQAFPSAATISLADWEGELGLPDGCSAAETSIAARLRAVRARFGALGGSSPGYMICLAASLGYDITVEEPTQALCDVSECIDGDIVEGWFVCDETGCDEPVETFALHAPPGYYGDEVAGGIVEDGFCCDDGICDDTPIESFDADPAGIVWKFWIVHIRRLGDTWFEAADGGIVETWFRCDEGEVGEDVLEGFSVLMPTEAEIAGAGEVASDPLEGFATAAGLECALRRVCPPHTELVFSYDVAA